MSFITVIIPCSDIQKYLVTFLDIKSTVVMNQVNKSFYYYTKITKIYGWYQSIQMLKKICICNRKKTLVINVQLQFLTFMRSTTKKNIYVYACINKLNDLVEYLFIHNYPNIRSHIEEFDKYVSRIKLDYDDNIFNIDKYSNVVELQKLLECHTKIKKKFNKLDNLEYNLNYFDIEYPRIEITKIKYLYKYFQK